MNKFLRDALILGTVGVVAGGSLAVIYSITKPRIQKTQQERLQRSLAKALPSADRFSQKKFGKKEYFEGTKNGNLIGFVFPTSGMGFGGEVKLLVGISTNGLVEGVVVLEGKSETPGLGTKAFDEKWLAQFKGIDEKKVPHSKEEFKANGLDAVNGATFTSMAVATGIANAFKMFNKVISNAVKGS